MNFNFFIKLAFLFINGGNYGTAYRHAGDIFLA